MTATALPSLFVSHGAPLFAIEAGNSGPALAAWGANLPADLRGVVVMSPHWMARMPAVMTNPQPKTWHDFGGFPDELYKLQYPAPGSPALGQQVIDLLKAAGIDAPGDANRPMDHGTWVPLMHLLPKANVPVVQVALPAGFGPREVFAMGAALRPLREQGILVMGSGSMTHNLGEFFGGGAPVSPYVTEFCRWIEDRLNEGNLDALFDYRTQAPNAVRAHPTDDHFLPLFFALGAASSDARPTYLTREVMYSMLAMDSLYLQ